MAEDEKYRYKAELLKYPLLVLSILVAVVALKFILGLEFGVVTELGTQGVRFAEQSQATEKALAELEARLNEADVRIAALEVSRQTSPSDARRIESDAFSAAQTVSDATASIARLGGNIPDQSPTLRGYIWIGDFDGEWQRAQLARLDTGQPIELPPEQIGVGTEYRVLGNMVVRDGLPNNDMEYFRGRPSPGVIPRGKTITVLRIPVGIDREYAVQYWAEVESRRASASAR